MYKISTLFLCHWNEVLVPTVLNSGLFLIFSWEINENIDGNKLQFIRNKRIDNNTGKNNWPLKKCWSKINFISLVNYLNFVTIFMLCCVMWSNDDHICERTRNRKLNNSDRGPRQIMNPNTYYRSIKLDTTHKYYLHHIIYHFYLTVSHTFRHFSFTMHVVRKNSERKKKNPKTNAFSVLGEKGWTQYLSPQIHLRSR